MSRRAELLAKNANIRAASEISEEELDRAAENHKPRSGQGSFIQRQRLEDRIKELETQIQTNQVASTKIELDKIVPNPHQPRRVFDEEALNVLAESIQSIGLLQPILVRSVSNRDTFEIVAGERRYRASKKLGHTTIPVIELPATDAEMAAYALAENISRADLSAYEIALSIKANDGFFKTKTSLASAIGIPRNAVYKYLAFFKLPDFVIDDLETSPGLIGRDTADAVATVITEHGAPAIEHLRGLWKKFKAGTLDQTKLAAALKAALAGKSAVRQDREIKKLFVGKHQAGSITRDAANLTIKLKTAVLTDEIERQLRAAVDAIFEKKA